MPAHLHLRSAQVGAKLNGGRHPLFCGIIGIAVIFSSARACHAADWLAGHDWTGTYVGAELGYAAGSSDWSAADIGGPVSAGSFGVFHGFNAFTGTGSYFGGVDAGYNYVFPSHLMLGVEANLSFPSDISGVEVVSSPFGSQASYSDTVLLFGTARGRIGYAFDNWLLYGTGGFALSRDQIDRTQVSGTAGGASAGDVDARFLTRFGTTVGAGIEVGLTSKVSGKLEYGFLDFPSSGVFFPLAAQQYNSDLRLHTVQLGLNYKLGDAGDEQSESHPAPSGPSDWAVHGQTTYVHEYAPPFRSPYVGTNSLEPNQARETWSSTLYLGFHLWTGAEFWIDPEVDQGFGFNDTHGVAGFTNGEAYKQGAEYPYARLPRYFFRQTIDLGGDTEKVEAGVNRFGGVETADRLVLTLGKFGVADEETGDMFDANRYAHSPRDDFLNWALVDTGTFDYAADAWGFTYGAAVAWHTGPWTLRGGIFDLSIVPNSTELDPTFSQFQWVGEIERHYALWDQPGKIALTGFLSRGRMGSFADAIALSEATGQPADIAAVRRYQSRSGVALNVEQQITPDIGFFARAGLADGAIEPYEFTDIDRTFAAGLSLSGRPWGRPDDTWGIAGVVNAISNVHAAFFNDGGLGILVGDGQLPHSGPEQILETYYSLPLGCGWRVSPDYQLALYPGYNRDRGPVSVITTRLHAEF